MAQVSASGSRGGGNIGNVSKAPAASLDVRGLDVRSLEADLRSELVLLPAVRAASDETLIVADGYSCREQIAQATTRRGMHVAEVIAPAMQSGAR